MKTFLATLAILLAPFAQAQINCSGPSLTAASCNASDVQAKLNAVAANYTTVNVPACPASSSITWASEVTYTGSYSICMIAAGNLTTVGGGDASVIFDGTGNANTPALALTVPAGGSIRLAGISIEESTATQKNNGSLQVTCNDTPGELRIDHSHLYYAYVGLQALDCFGVVDHNIFDQPSSSGTDNSVHVWNPNYNASGAGPYGDGSWATATNPGTSDYLYFEDDVFNYGAANDCKFGGRQVYRFNTFNTSGLQTHPTGGDGPNDRGCRSTEVYENLFNASNSNPYFDLFWLSSGTMYIWGNQAPTGFENFITLHEQRMCQTGGETCYTETAPPDGWGYCGTYVSGVLSAWDGNQNATSGYPCLDQPGRGIGQLITGTMPSAINNSTGTIAWTSEALEPIYEWMDTYAQVPDEGGSFWSVYDTAAFAANQDYYLSQDPTTGDNVTFTGASGTGYGTLSSRPSTCTAGVGYFATDQGSWNHSGGNNVNSYSNQGILYECASTNSWSSYYTPYTYPHPLVGSSTQAQPAPSRTGFLMAKNGDIK